MIEDTLANRIKELGALCGANQTKYTQTTDNSFIVGSQSVVNFNILYEDVYEDKDDVQIIINKMNVVSKHLRFMIINLTHSMIHVVGTGWKTTIRYKGQTLLPLQEKHGIKLSYAMIRSHKYIIHGTGYTQEGKDFRSVKCQNCGARAIQHMNDKNLVFSNDDLTCNERIMKEILE